eukprot:15328988-Ditylum_brightwellii.AAC.1
MAINDKADQGMANSIIAKFLNAASKSKNVSALDNSPNSVKFCLHVHHLYNLIQERVKYNIFQQQQQQQL